MKISFKSDENASIIMIFGGSKGEELILTDAASGFDAKSNGRISQAAKAANFKGAANSLLTIHAPIDGVAICILAGLGDFEKIDGDTVEKASASAIKSIVSNGTKDAAILIGGFGENDALYGARAAFGAKLATYRFDKYRTKLKPAQKLTLESLNVNLEASASVFAKYEAIGDGVYFARDLMNEPPNVLTTNEFAARLKELSSLGVEVEIVDAAKMAELKMFSYLGVGQGSVNPPQMVVMKYNGGGDAPLIALVGKGLCFDSGGISLKPSGGMEDMKGDMGGAAAVAGTMKALAARKAKANIVAIVGLAENMPDAGAQRPGDIVTSMSGQTIEVLNTDAEGRLVLCDCLTYAQEKFAPKYIIDVATLTGAIVIALGSEYAGLFTNSDEMATGLSAAGATSGEKVWRFPLSPAYDKQLDSNIADMKNVQRSGPGAGAGSITAAQFLQRFINDGTNWAHLDIAGTAWQSGSDDARCPSWGTGFGVRLLDKYIEQNFEK